MQFLLLSTYEERQFMIHQVATSISYSAFIKLF